MLCFKHKYNFMCNSVMAVFITWQNAACDLNNIHKLSHLTETIGKWDVEVSN